MLDEYFYSITFSHVFVLMPYAKCLSIEWHNVECKMKYNALGKIEYESLLDGFTPFLSNHPSAIYSEVLVHLSDH